MWLASVLLKYPRTLAICATVIGVLVVVGAIYGAGYRAHIADDNAARLDSIGKANEVSRDVQKMDRPAIDRELSRWMRN